MISVNIPKTHFKRKYSKYMDQVDFALVQTTNATLFDSKKYFERLMDVNFDGGATRFTKQQIRYSSATKQQPIGVLFVTRSGSYIITVMDGGVVKPFPGMTGLVQPANVRVNKYGNLRRGYVKQKSSESKFFVGTPAGMAKNDRNYGLWQRVGQRNKSSTISKTTGKTRNMKGKTGKLKLIVSMGKRSRPQKKTFSGRQLAAKYAAHIFSQKFETQLAKAIVSSNRI
jgi:hypothetical protein